MASPQTHPEPNPAFSERTLLPLARLSASRLCPSARPVVKTSLTGASPPFVVRKSTSQSAVPSPVAAVVVSLGAPLE